LILSGLSSLTVLFAGGTNQDFVVNRATAARATGAISSTTGNANNHAVSQALVQAPMNP
jgi:hypothetical protein